LGRRAAAAAFTRKWCALLKSAVKRLLRQTPYRVIRAQDANRFGAIEETLLSLGNRGYLPKIVIDGGANVGEFAQLARNSFPYVTVHMIEPQPACAKILQQLDRKPEYIFHPVGLSSGREDQLTLAVDLNGVTTGAHIVLGQTDQSTCKVAAASLDQLFAHMLLKQDRALLKLDLQGFELEALKGAGQVLKVLEVLLVEVSFFAQAYEPPASRLIRLLDDHDFELQDVASISARRRDNRAQQADFLFIKRSSPLMMDNGWT
jgi:FkbM family methyltransferase